MSSRGEQAERIAKKEKGDKEEKRKGIRKAGE
jgi:hypothetical protein